MLAEFAGIRTWSGSQGRREVGRRPSLAAGGSAGAAEPRGLEPGRGAEQAEGREQNHTEPLADAGVSSLPGAFRSAGPPRWPPSALPGGRQRPPAPRTRRAVSRGSAGPCARGSAAKRGRGPFCDGTRTPSRVPRAEAAGAGRVRRPAGARAEGTGSLRLCWSPPALLPALSPCVPAQWGHLRREGTGTRTETQQEGLARRRGRRGRVDRTGSAR